MKIVPWVIVALTMAMPMWQATACSIGRSGDYTVRKHMEAAYAHYDFIVEGTIREIHKEFFSSKRSADFIVSKVWKGDLQVGKPIVLAIRSSGTSCDYELSAPATMLLFLEKDGDRLSMWTTMGSSDVDLGTKTYTLFAEELARISGNPIRNGER